MIATYEVQAFTAWEELERTVNGQRRKFITWSNSACELRNRATWRESEASDEEVAAADLGGTDLIAVDPDGWRRLRNTLEVPNASLSTSGSIGTFTPCPLLAREHLLHGLAIASSGLQG